MNIRPERQRLSIDPYYTPPLCDVIFDPSSPQSSPSPSSFILPQSAVSLRLAMPSTPLSRSQPEWRLCFALCLYDFDPTDPDHLPFEKNEILEIVRKEDSGWWAALRGDEVGWIPSAFVAEISVEDAERLSGVRLELRVCEWEAEKLFSTEPAPAPEPQRTASFSYYKDDWNTSIEPEMKDAVVVVTNFPGDIAVPHPHSHISSDHLDAYWEDSTYKARKNKHISQPLLRTSASVTSLTVPGRLRRPSLQTKIPPVPSQPSPSANSPHSPLNRSRSESSPTALSRPGRRRTQGSLKSLSSLTVLLDSPQSENEDFPVPHLERDLASLALSPTQRRSDKIRKLTGDDDAQAFHNARVAQANLPWYLKPSYTADDIKMEYDGSVRAGTLPALVERLTADSLKMSQEKLYRDVFLSTFRTFTTATELFDLLSERFNMLCPLGLSPEQSTEWREKKLIPVQKRVLAIFTNWIDNHNLAQECPEIIPLLRQFLMSVVSPASSVLTAKHALQQLEKTGQQGNGFQISITPPSPPVIPRKKKPPKQFKNDLLKIDPADLAGQLMLYEFIFYSKVRGRECYTWAKRQSGEGLENLLAFSATHDCISAWVKSTILLHEGIGKRVDSIEFWIKVAEKCRIMNNLSSMSAIVAALSSAVLSHLRLTWAHVSRMHMHTLSSLTRLTDPSSNFSAYRVAIQAADGPCVPFIGCFLTDLVHINDRYKDIAYYPLVSSELTSSSLSSAPPTVDCFDIPPKSSTSQTFSIGTPQSFPGSSSHWPQTASSVQSTFPLRGPPLINIVKRRKWYETIQKILRFQGRQPVVQENEALQAFVAEQIAIASPKARDSSGFWDRSTELQQSEKADIRTGLEAAGF